MRLNGQRATEAPPLSTVTIVHNLRDEIRRKFCLRLSSAAAVETDHGERRKGEVVSLVRETKVQLNVVSFASTEKKSLELALSYTYIYIYIYL